MPANPTARENSTEAEVVAEWRAAMEGVPPEEWSASEQKGPPRRCFVAQVFQGAEGRSIACLDATPDEAEASRTAAWLARCSPSGIASLLAIIERQGAEMTANGAEIERLNGVFKLVAEQNVVEHGIAVAAEAEAARLKAALKPFSHANYSYHRVSLDGWTADLSDEVEAARSALSLPRMEADDAG
jgi:hypothetical protein